MGGTKRNLMTVDLGASVDLLIRLDFLSAKLLATHHRLHGQERQLSSCPQIIQPFPLTRGSLPMKSVCIYCDSASGAGDGEQP